MFPRRETKSNLLNHEMNVDTCANDGSQSPNGSSGAKKRFTLKSLLIAITFIALAMAVLRVRSELAATYSYTGTVDIKADFHTFHPGDTELLPFFLGRKQVNGVEIHINALWRQEEWIWGAVFEVTGNGWNHAEKRRQLEAEMDAFLELFPDIEFGGRRTFFRAADGSSRELAQ